MIIVRGLATMSQLLFVFISTTLESEYQRKRSLSVRNLHFTSNAKTFLWMYIATVPVAAMLTLYWRVPLQTVVPVMADSEIAGYRYEDDRQMAKSRDKSSKYCPPLWSGAESRQGLGQVLGSRNTQWVIITGTPTKSGISLLLGHIYGYDLAWLSPR